ncbi:RelA/SpoT domain-containing protein [Sinomonas gamaensis]|uniref:RelA/SpoT domain-containing protein n=1 Tax=Sinomonas gamaensis TaxID=2565624 RepID=UPI002015FCF5|nr:RelA/SpoT domain-containing protein [Sinomonas gamaensis]
MPAPSRKSVRKAGSTVRRFHRGECSQEDLDAANEVLVAYRAQFTRPLVATHGRLVRLRERLGLEAEITQRLKKHSTILDKLRREPKLDLSLMQDIGGCRAVVGSISVLRDLEQAVVTEWGTDVDRVRDYVKEPRASGYRAIHVVVIEAATPIEIQLRTEQMHTWAQMVEAFSSALGDNFKQDGSHPVQEYMSCVAELNHIRDSGEGDHRQILARLEKLHPVVEALLTSSNSG